MFFLSKVVVFKAYRTTTSLLIDCDPDDKRDSAVASSMFNATFDV